MPLPREIKLPLAANQIRQVRGVNCLEAALGSRHPFRCPCRNRLVNALTSCRPRPRNWNRSPSSRCVGGGDHNRPRLGQGLKTGRNVGGVADQSTPPKRTPTTQMSRPVAKRREKQKVGTISADNDAAIGEMVDDAMENVGGEGVITVEERVRRCLTPILTPMIN